MPHNHQRVLVYCQEESAGQMLVKDLIQSGYSVKECHSISDFRIEIQAFQPELVILETFSKGTDCFFLIPEMRGTESFKLVPIIVIAGIDDMAEKINALKMGADDCLCRPIQMDELLLKMQALFRRMVAPQPQKDQIVYKNIKLSPISGEVFIDDTPLQFTETEFKLLLALVIEKGKPVRRESLSFRTLSSRNKNARTVDVHINSIRNKLGTAGSNIKTLRGRGYMLVDETRMKFI